MLKKALQNQEILERVTQTVFETFGAIKDLKILNKEKEIQKYFDSKIKILSKILIFSFMKDFPESFGVNIYCDYYFSFIDLFKF